MRPTFFRTLALVIVVALPFAAVAEDIDKKFRIGLSLGGFNSQDEVGSDAGNVLTLVERDFSFARQYADPRNDSSVFGNFELQPGAIATLSGQYAVNKILVVEATIAYSKLDLGDIEVQAQFDGIEIDETDRFNFSTFRIPAGEVTRVPVTLTALARFRPRAKFHPYVGAGFGYSFIGFDAAPEFQELSRRMDASFGTFYAVSESTFGNETLFPVGQSTDLEGASVDIGDTFEYHIAGGAELSFKNKWSAFLDFRWSRSSRSLQIGFNGGDDLGVAVPQFSDFVDSDVANSTFGSVRITSGGLVDGGQLVPDSMNPNANCDLTPGNCVFAPQKDGEPDPGFYYAQGGRLDLGGLAFQVGVRYTF